MNTKHRAKKINYYTWEYRGVKIENRALYYSDGAGYEFTVGQEDYDYVLRSQVEPTLWQAKQEIDSYFLWKEMDEEEVKA